MPTNLLVLAEKRTLLEAAMREQQAGTLTFRELIEIEIDYDQCALLEIEARYDLARQLLERGLLNGNGWWIAERSCLDERPGGHC